MHRYFIRISTLLALLTSVTSWATSFGKIAGQDGVSATGGAQYSIHLWTPPGTHGVAPNLSLQYDSQTSYGPVGPGWRLGGLSIITRCNLTYAQDGVPAAVTLTSADGLCLDGKRLRTTGTGVYQTEIADFSQITASGTAGNGPAYFTVQRNDGLIYEYGNTSDSQFLAGTAPTPYAWALDKVTDRSGNQMVIAYYGTLPFTIQYTAPSGSTTFPYQVEFQYQSKSTADTISYYVAGQHVAESSQLSIITVTNAGATLRKYNLGYQAAATTLHQELTSIQECGGSAATDCLAPTAIAYQGGTAGMASPTTATGSGSTNGVVYSVDIDGDGKKDLVFAVTSGSTYQWWVQIATASGYQAPVNSGAVTNGKTNFLLDDFAANGTTQILAPVGSVWYVYRWNGSAFTATSTGVSVAPTGIYSSIDVDGDGRPDLVNVTAGASASVNYAIQLNLSSAGTVGFATAPTIETFVGVYGAPLTILGAYGNNQFTNTDVKHIDFDGDGRQDLLVYASYKIGSATYYVLIPLESRGGSAPPVLGSALGSVTTPIQVISVVNWNDDKCTDFVQDTIIRLSACSGTGLAYVTLPATATLFLDWDGDGRTDALSQGPYTWLFIRSEGSAAADAVGTLLPFAAGTFTVTDQNGDGLDDWIFAASSSNYALSYGLHLGANVKPDLATSITDGYGVSNSFSYVAMSAAPINQYTKGTSQVWPEEDYIGPLNIVTSVVSTDGIGGTYTKTYSYKSAVTDLQGRGFQGIFTVKNLDSRTGFSDYKDYHTAFPYNGMLQYHIVNQSSPGTVRNVTYGWTDKVLDANPYNQRYLPYYTTITDQAYEVGGTLNGQLITTRATTYNTPDGYGNFATISSTTTDNDPNSPYLNKSWTTSTAYTVSPDHGVNWCLNLPTEIDVSNTSPGSGSAYAITRHTQYIAPDYVHCRQTEQVVEPGSTYQVDTKYLYTDSFGNLTGQTVTGQGMSARTSTISWTPSTGQFPVSVSNALAQVSQVNFDPNTGEILSSVDPNGLTTAWTYDNFGRRNKQTRPDGTSTTWAYNSCATAGCVNTNNQMTVVQTNLKSDGTTLNIGNVYLDIFDRVLVSSKQMLSGAYDRNEVQYDQLGNIHKQLAPCTFVSCTQYQTTNTYDSLNRLTLSQRPINASGGSQSTGFAYTGRTTTTTDANGIASSVITKVTGAMGRTTDANGYYVNFDHDAFGAPLSAKDSQSHTLQTATYGYGLRAFAQTSYDIDASSKTYTIDALGEITAYTDAKGQSFAATYDALSRPLTRTEPDPSGTFTTTWSWGTSAASHNIGRLASVSSAAAAGTYSENYGFDSSGRLSNETIAIPGAGSNQFDLAYDSITGLLNTVTYPASYPSTYRLKATYAYEYGLLFYISDANNPSTTWYTAATMNPRGQITAEKTSDSSADQTLHLSKGFDAVTGWMSGSYAGVGSGSGTSLQNEAYLYDKLGNVMQRQNNNAGLTENFYYDKLSRLYYSTLGGSTNLQMCYDNLGGACTENLPGMGNISSRSDVAGGAAWTYDPTHVHEVTQAGSASYTYTYDANGNAKTRNGSTIGWTSYNYPSSVSTASESASFDYGPNRQRWHMAYSGAAGIENTYYATPNFEIVATSAGTDYRHYLYAYGAPKLVISRTTAGAVNVRSLLTDHQGSISSIVANSTGSSVVSESFTAYGNRREASSWSGAPTSGELTAMNGVTRQGYTFQTVLGSMGLNHMNGRIEDAVTGRFLSADPVIDNARNTQSFNLYSYVKNNPVSRTDPTGFDDDCDPDSCVVVQGQRPFGSPGGGGGGGDEGPHGSRSSESAGNDRSSSQPHPDFNTVNSETINTFSIYSDVGAAFHADPNGLSLDVSPLYTDDAGIEGVTVTATVIRPGQGSFNFAALARSPTLRAAEPILNAAAAGVLGAPVLAGLALLPGGAAAEAAQVVALNANKLNHIFGNLAHNLGSLVQQFGSQADAFNAIQSAVQATVESQGLAGVFETVVDVGGTQVTVRGAVVDGVVKIGTAFIP